MMFAVAQAMWRTTVSYVQQLAARSGLSQDEIASRVQKLRADRAPKPKAPVPEPVQHSNVQDDSILKSQSIALVN